MKKWVITFTTWRSNKELKKTRIFNSILICQWERSLLSYYSGNRIGKERFPLTDSTCHTRSEGRAKDGRIFVVVHLMIFWWEDVRHPSASSFCCLIFLTIDSALLGEWFCFQLLITIKWETLFINWENASNYQQ